MSKRTDILAHVKSTLEGTPPFAVGQVFVGKQENVQAESLTFPSLFVVGGRYEKSPRQVVQFETYDWLMTVEIACAEASVENLIALVHQTLYADRTLGGHAVECELLSGEPLMVDAGRALSSFLQTYQITYRHPIGSP